MIGDFRTIYSIRTPALSLLAAAVDGLATLAAIGLHRRLLRLSPTL
ncbi:MAG: hypothetical protein HY690_03425 [Chloroflexi bacterium]|nr:hypothetical protein [Chloroflexota bacterium]